MRVDGMLLSELIQQSATLRPASAPAPLSTPRIAMNAGSGTIRYDALGHVISDTGVPQTISRRRFHAGAVLVIRPNTPTPILLTHEVA